MEENFDIDLTNVTEEIFTDTLNDYNSGNVTFFRLQQNPTDFSLVSGDTDPDFYATGSLRELAFFWNGLMSGIALGDTSISDDE